MTSETFLFYKKPGVRFCCFFLLVENSRCKKNKKEKLNVTRREETVFYSVQHKNGCLAASELFHMFTQLINSIHSKRVQRIEKGNSSGGQQKRMVAPFSKLYGKI